MSLHQVSVDIGGRSMTFETGRMARLAAGAVTVRLGESIVLSAASTSPPRPGLDFFPLTLDYREKTYAAGKIPGGFLKRESAPSPKEILTMRMADRPIRPLWPEGFRDEVQVQSLVLSYDQLNDPDVLSINGAAAAVALAPLPFLGPVGAVRVGRVGGAFVCMPDNAQILDSDLNIVVAGTASAVTMVEAGAQEVPEDVILEALDFAHDHIQRICAAVAQLRANVGWVAPTYESPTEPGAAAAAVEANVGPALEAALHQGEKKARQAALHAVRENVRATLALGAAGDEDGRFPAAELDQALQTLEKRLIRRAALSGRRIDGRRPDEIRPITIEVGLLPRAHGSALFTRGETQVLAATTLGTGMDEKLEDGLHLVAYSRKYYLHYNFPPLCVGETRPIRGPSRREVGHGALAERALLPVLPAMEDFPYTIRIVADVLMSNGSSSMASVCSTTLSMMDAGIQIRRPVAGIAMGLVEEDGEAVVLSDILGDEDHAGDMDFKVAGTQTGITALQMDIKQTGVSRDVLRRALEQAREGRIHILKQMLQVISHPRAEINSYAPRIEVVMINPEKIGMLIGPGGKNIRRLQEETGSTVEVDDTGRVKIFAFDRESAAAARQRVEAIAEEATVGKIYDGKVTSVKDFGAFFEIIPGVEGLCHISELANGYVESVSQIVSIGEIHPVKVILVDESGRVKLSRRQAFADLGQEDPLAAALPAASSAPSREDRFPPRGPRHSGRDHGGHSGGHSSRDRRGGRGPRRP